VVAAGPAEHDPFTIVSATTYLKVNPLAMMGGSITQKNGRWFPNRDFRKLQMRRYLGALV
jgi:hypothetical protein